MEELKRLAAEGLPSVFNSRKRKANGSYAD